MSTFQPQTPGWLSPAWDQFYMDDPELQEAYGYPDYPSDMTGEGNWIDMFLDVAGQFPVGRLWLAPDTGSVGLEAVLNGDQTWLTKAALELREFNKHNVGIFSAYDYIKAGYYCGEEQTGDLKDARVNIDA
jgi:hypothetical protein